MLSFEMLVIVVFIGLSVVGIVLSSLCRSKEYDILKSVITQFEGRVISGLERQIEIAHGKRCVILSLNDSRSNTGTTIYHYEKTFDVLSDGCIIVVEYNSDIRCPVFIFKDEEKRVILQWPYDGYYMYHRYETQEAA